MAEVYPREAERWGEGDKAYCVRNRVDAEPRLEKGRVYHVARAVKPRGIAHHGLQLVGVTALNDLNGFWSNCFIRLEPGQPSLRTIDRDTEYTCEHYWNRS